MNLLFGLIILSFSFYGCISKGDKKLIPLVCVLLCFVNRILLIPDTPFFHSGRMAIFSVLIFCAVLQYSSTKKIWDGFPFKYQLIFMLGVSFIIAFFSKCVPDLQHKISIPLFEFAYSYLLLFIAYLYAGNNTFKTLENILIICIILLTLAGVANWILRYNPYVALLDSVYQKGLFDFAHKFTYAERFRISSLFDNPFDYGYICLMLNVTAIYLKQVNKIKRLSFCLLFISSLFGIISCNCRTVPIVYAIGVSIYFLLTQRLNRSIAYFLIFIIFYSIAYLSVPFVENKTEQLISVVTDYRGKEVKGSSLNLRQTQLLGSLYFFKKNPIVGNGYNYINDELGWRKQKISDKNRKMAGYESIVFILLIEKGIIGIIAYLLFYGSILYYLIKNRKYDMSLAAFGIAIFSIYIFFSIATGELMSVPVTLFFLGIIVKQIEIRKVESFFTGKRRTWI